jgi:hypothetical protein
MTGHWRKVKAKEVIEPAEVFFGVYNDEKIVWVAECTCEIHALCPASKGLDKACSVYDGFVLLERVKPVPRSRS